MMPRNARLGILLLAVLTATLGLDAQQQSSQQPNVPDAPSATQKPSNFPPPSASDSKPQPAPPEPQPAPSNSGSASGSSAAAKSPKPPPSATADDAAPPPAGPRVTTARPATAPAGGDNSRDALFTLVTRVNFVVVPVTVKDQTGRLVDGLLRRDFAVLEDGVPQQIQLFTSDPFPLSAAVVIDTGLPDAALRKIEDTLPALAGAFSAFDEVAIYLFDRSVEKLSDFSAAGDRVSAALNRLRYVEDPTTREMRRRQGRQGGVPSTGGPLNSSPTINGKNVDPNAPIVPVVRPDPHVLNDAVLAAANDLAKRERTRRRMLFVISDGRELGSRASYQDVLKVLLSHEVSVYALAPSSPVIPGYGTLQKLHVPGLGYGDILPKYAAATGGDVITEFSAKGIETAYALATGQARNEYTLGYTTRATAASNYREIEVRVHRPNLKVTAKTGYYPVPQERPAPAPAETAAPPRQ